MRKECLGEVSSALGRQLLASQGKSIEARVRNQMRQLARANPEDWRAKTYTDRLHEAASAAATEMKEEFAKKRQIIEKKIAVHDRIENFLADQPNTKAGDALRAVSRLADFDTRAGGYTSIQSAANAIRNEVFSNLIDTWKAVPGNFFGLFENEKGVSDLWKEIHGEASGNPVAKAGAKAWAQATEELRQRFNDGGGTVGKLEDWGAPQHHSQARVASAGIDKWIGDILPKLDRDKYVNIDGTRFSNEQMHDFLTHAFESIITDGHNSPSFDPVKGTYSTSVSGTGVIASRNAAHRQIFFKDAEAHGQYNSLYGEQSLSSLLTGHITRMARDVALVEQLGPDAAATFKYFNERAAHDELLQATSARAQNRVEKMRVYNERLFDAVAGKDQVVNQTLADNFQAFRNWMTATKLGKVVITALSDEAGMFSTAVANKVPYSEVLMNELRAIPPGAAREFAEHSALGLDAMMGSLNRFAQEEFGSSFSGKMASAVMRLSGAERMWAARRQGLGITIMSAIGKLSRTIEHVDQLTPEDHGVLARKGVTDKTWQVWRRATPEDFGGKGGVLTAKSIWAIPDEQLADLGNPRALKREAATMLLAHTLEESGMGAMDTGPRQRVAVNLGTQRGTVGGEIWRSMNLFRSFAFSMMMKHWNRAASMPGIFGKMAYLAPLALYGTVIAAAGNQVRNLLAGQDPDQMIGGKDWWKFWGKALLRGGGLGFFGDFLYDETTGGDTTLAAALGGPALTTLEDLWNVSGGAAFKAGKGEKTDERAKLIRFASQNIPVINMWYTQQAANHLLWNHLQEAASPGYLARMQARQENTFGKHYYWRPDQSLPQAAPDLARAVRGDPNVSFAGN